VKKKYLVVPGLLLALMLVGAGLQTRAASPAPEPPRPRPFHRELEEFPFLAPEPADPELQVQEGVAAASFVPWSKLVFQSYRDGDWNLYLANGDGSDQTRATAHRAHDIHPRLNRGSARIVFSASRADNYDIYVTNPGLTQLTSDPADDVNPFWSPDGTKIAFQSYRDGQSEIYVMNADGSSQTRLTWDGAYDGDPAWSPDGSKLAFTSNRTGGYRIWVMNADGSGQMQLSDQAYSENPVWSPDGSQIAYNSDGDGDDWQELWLMNTDGSNQREIYDPGGIQTDAWAGSWSPDGRYVAYTRISFIYYQGNWYWTTAYLDVWDSMNPWHYPIRLSDQGTDWNPDWQTTDVWVPASSMNALPAQSPGPFTVSWSGADAGPSGLLGYDVQVREGAGAWTDWLVGTRATSASYPGIGGHTYSFRVRARDNSYNVEPWPPDYGAATTVEALPPTTVVRQLPAYSRGSASLSWSGSDSGGSGIETYDVQYRKGGSGSWTNWLVGTTDTSVTLFGALGQTYHFRSRATDRAQNVGNWSSENGDTLTTFYAWKVTGGVRDNTGAPVVGAVVTTTPEALTVIPSDNEGNLTAYIASSETSYGVAWEKNGYDSLPTTGFSAVRDGYLDVFLPPADNVVHDWGFENGGLQPEWLVSGVFSPGVTTSPHHTGKYAALLGCQEGVFSVPRNISNLSGPDLPWTYSPAVVVDDKGVVHVVWAGGFSGDYWVIYYAQRANDGTWSVPQNISNQSALASNPQLAVDGSGTVHVVWRYDPGWWLGCPDIYYARRTNNGAWSAPQNISNSAVESWNPALAVDGNELVHVIWQENPSEHYEIYYAQRTGDGSWTAPRNLSSSTLGWSDSHVMIIDKNSAVHIAWQESLPDSSDDIYYIRRDSNGIWSTPLNITNDELASHYPQLAIDGNGIVHLIWRDDWFDIRYARRESDGTWSTPWTIIAPPYSVSEPRLAVGNDGVVHTTWVAYTPDEGGIEVHYAWRAADGTWSEPQSISHNPDEFEEAVHLSHLAVDGTGTVHAIWTTRLHIATEAFVYYARRPSGSDWSAPRNISSGTGKAEYAQLAIEGSKSVHVVWQGDISSPYQIYYAHAASTEQTGDSNIAQAITIPASPSVSTLSFLYQIDGASPSSGSWFNVQVGDEISATTLFSTTSNSAVWTHLWFDLTTWAGRSMTLTFNVHQTADHLCTFAYLDEVTVGSTYPDLWVRKNSIAALPGEQIVYRITYGNRGGTSASGVRITDTLPGALSLVDVSSLPITATTSSLVWDVGDLSAKSGPFNIVVTATVAPTATVLNSFTATVHIGANSPELEKANNVAQTVVFVGRRIYMPLIFKGYAE
jgi:uncharacterized repeat protein (TIGR01451 family)